MTPEVAARRPAFGLGVDGAVTSPRRRSRGASGDSVEFTAEAVADAMAAAARAETVTAQRLAVTSWLANAGISSATCARWEGEGGRRARGDRPSPLDSATRRAKRSSPGCE